MAEGKNRNNHTKQMADVAKPGATRASATSRPVIVKHATLLKDPMMASSNPSQLEEKESKDTASSKANNESVSRRASTIDPPDDTTDTAANKKEDTTDTASEAVAVSKETSPENSEPTKTNNSSINTAAVDVLANEVVKQKELQKEDKEKLKLIQKHIQDRTYFVPIGQLSKRRAKIHSIILFFVLVLLIAGYLAVDYGLILQDIALPFELFR